MFFENVIEGLPDAVFGLTGAFRADPREQKVNLLVGIYKNEQLQNEIMPTVCQAMKECPTNMADYLPMDGCKEMIDGLGPLVFGKLWSKHPIYGAQAVGGTGALRIGAEFLAQEVGKKAYIPQPSWPNHRSIFERAQFQVETYPYYNRKTGFDMPVFSAFLEKLEPKSIVLLHAACHNPTGSDPTLNEWKEIARIMKKRELLPFFDFAYHGLGDGLENDAAAVRHFVQEGMECLVAYSCSKNFSLYCQRVGALFVVLGNQAQQPKVASQVQRIIRAEFSNPPAFGAKLVAHILHGKLRSDWEKDLINMRERLQSVRIDFAKRLIKKKPGHFQRLLEHKGMFSFIDLEKSQVARLRDQFAIYMLDNGRINIAGINRTNLDTVVDSIIAVS